MISRRDFLQSGLAWIALPQLLQGVTSAPSEAQDELWYAQSAERWLQALPIGNGRIGGMIYGGTRVERIALSESTVWSGEPSTGEVNPEALSHLSEIRQLLFEGKYTEANDLCRRYLLPHPKNFGTNLPLPELRLTFEGIEQVSGYRRFLNLNQALAGVSFRSGHHVFSREVIASHADQLLAVHLRCSDPKSILFRLGFGETSLPCSILTAEGNTLILRGHAYERKHSNGKTGVVFEIAAHVAVDDGSVKAEDHSILVQGASAATLRISIGTSFGGGAPGESCADVLRRTAGRSYAELRQRHIADYQPLYRRMFLHLGSTPVPVRQQPTDVRRRALEDGRDDPELLALFFQYGRYLSIAGSRHDSPLPLALQGIWNDGLASSMGWTDDFHLDINTQQNYWPAEVCNLPECMAPLFSLIDTIRTSGRVTAREMYGAPGWVAHTVTNPWGYTAPGWGVGWGLYVTAGVWIALQVWQHYTFTGDMDFLRTKAYPVLREAAEFFLAHMVPEPKHGWLVTGPSDSPENWYLTPDGHRAAESMGNTCDRVFVHALYSVCIDASKILASDEIFRHKLEDARAKLPPFQIGRHGQLQEWLEDFEDADPNHRHTSHLVSLYPEHQISPRSTPELARAAEVTIERRMNTPNWEQSEWGRANLVVYYARLLKGDLAHKYFVSLIAKAADDNLLTYSSGGVAGAEQNIFAIDGNTAGSASVAEMLLQSQAGEIELLPALPSAWASGSVRGLCARGGYVVSIDWRNGRLISARIRSTRGGAVPVRYHEQTRMLHFRPGQTIRLYANTFSRHDAPSHCDKQLG